MARKETCPAVVSIDINLSSYDQSTTASVRDRRKCRLTSGHKGRHRFKMYLRSGGRVADAEVLWSAR